MTVFAWAAKRRFARLPTPEARLFRVTSDSQVLGHCHWQARRQDHPTLLVLHGLEGSSSVHYMRGVADKAWRRGWNVVLLNQRNCGGTERLAPGLYHSGLTDDPRAVMRAIAETDGVRQFGVVGYSLGGNLAVKLAGEAGDHPDIPLAAVAAVCPTVDLERCVRAIERRRNFPYHFNFVRNLRKRMRQKDVAWPGLFDLTPLGRVWSIRTFDDIYTAPYHGFGDATTYYYRASALRVVTRIAIPTLILAAEDDPFVPHEQFLDPSFHDNPTVTVRISRHGGHCGFVADAIGEDDGYWAETTSVDFLTRAVEAAGPGMPAAQETPAQTLVPSLPPRA